MAARVLEVCDAAAAAITAAMLSPVDATVSRVYLPDVTFDDLETTSGRFVYVFPIGYEQAGIATRGADLNEYMVGVITIERYTPGGVPTTAWLDERLLWVEEKILDVLGDPRNAPIDGTLYPETAAVTVAYDPGELRSRKLFWSEAVFGFREPG